MTPPLTDEQLKAFHSDGFVVVESFYHPTEIEPIQRGIHTIIGLVIEEEGLAIEQPPFAADAFDAGFQDLIAHDRALGGRVYDAIKQIPAFMRLVASEKHEAVVRQVRGTDAPAIAAGGYGIFTSQHVQRAWRDAHAIAHHISFNWDALSSMYGQHLLGLEPQGQF